MHAQRPRRPGTSTLLFRASNPAQGYHFSSYLFINYICNSVFSCRQTVAIYGVCIALKYQSLKLLILRYRYTVACMI